jgi:anti-anti-sigma factor
VDKLGEAEIEQPFVFPEGAGLVYKHRESFLWVKYYPGPGIELVVEIVGEIDSYSSPGLRALLIDAVNMGYRDLIFLLDGVSFLDSIGLVVLVGSLRRTRSVNGHVKIVCNQERINKIFRITGLIKVFELYDTLPEALAAASIDNNIADFELLFRMYIPAERMYAAEACRLIGLFRNWLTTTCKHGIRQSGYQTASGEMFEFYADASLAELELPEQFSRFSSFLALCADDEEAALDLLTATNLSDSIRSDLVHRFGREVRRLQVDLRHERERRILTLRQSLEQEFVANDADFPQLPGDQIGVLLERFVPGPSASQSLALLAGPASPVQAGSLTVNINPQIVNAMESTIIQNIQGVVNLGPQAKELLALIDRFGGAEAASLQSDVHELEDDDAPSASRSAARRRLKKFLGDLAGTVNEVGLSLLEKYLEMKLGLPT